MAIVYYWKARYSRWCYLFISIFQSPDQRLQVENRWFFRAKYPIHSVRPFFFFKLIITVSIDVFDHANHTRKKRSTMGNDQFSRTDSLLFNLKIEASVLLDLVIQIQPFQRGWTLKPDVSVKQGEMFYFCMLKSIIGYKSVKPKYSHSVF